jgi:hypothetical protein
MKNIQQMVSAKSARIIIGLLVAGQASAQGPDKQDLEAAKQQFEQSSHDETARVRYVTKLADMSAQLTPKILHNPDVDAKVAYANQAGAIEQELRKHPCRGTSIQESYRSCLSASGNLRDIPMFFAPMAHTA